ncbi:MAG: sulfatase-like hydrolase/transferase [Opitutaceae bacterium]|nr:sulfatase-like hydrolase/transferase [Opitutaceae bacterium]
MRTWITLVFTLAATAAGIAAQPARPNIVLLMSDDQGWGETGYNGHPHLKTPVLDEMARTGLRLDRFYAASPVCSPTRASVMTGRHANRSGAFAPNWSTRPEEITIAQILRQAGYRTGHFGKWHLGPVKRESPLNPNRMGFDEYLSHDNFFELNPPLSRNGAAPEIVPGESSEVIVAEAIRFARRVRSEDRPFLIVIHFGSPHSPYSGRPEDIAPYAYLGSPLSERFAEIAALDRAVGQFRSALRELQVRDNTLVWFNADNGMTWEGVPDRQRKDQFNAGWRGHKGELYEGGVLVPGLIEWPAVIRAPRTSAVRAVTSDILPTVLDLLGLKHPAPQRPIDGISLKALLVDGTMRERPSPIGFWKYAAQQESRNERWISADLARGTTPTTRNPAIDFQNFRHPVARTADFGGEAAWTDNRYKLITGEGRRAKAGARTELYDLIADPRETRDLAAEHPDVVARMTRELHAWQRSVERSLSGADY